MHFRAKKIIKVFLFGIVITFAIFGLVLTVGFFAVKFGFTNIPGAIDLNDRKLNLIYQNSKNSQTDLRVTTEIWCAVSVLQNRYPRNASFLSQYIRDGGTTETARRMIDVILLHIRDSSIVQQEIASCGTRSLPSYSKNIFPWMETSEWQALRLAIIKDIPLIQKVSMITGVPARLIATQLVVEQMRLFVSDRELFKQVFSPLKILGSQTQFSLGVTGLKEETAQAIERNLVDSQSVFYLGKSSEHLLDFENSQAIAQERIARITDSHNHYYSYLYTALFLKQILIQWQKAGFDISDRPEIVSTLFNVGFSHSQPNPNPSVGGAIIEINGAPSTFGALAYDFYYSGELQDQLPL